MKRFFRFLYLHFVSFTCLILAGSAVADDGRFEINQLCVSTGCFDGDNPGFPVEIDNPGSYVLTSDLVVPAGINGIVISADNTRIDLNGQAVSGPVQCSGTNPDCLPTTTGFGFSGSVLNLVIANGTVSGFGQDCIAISGEGLHLRDLIISNCRGNGINTTSAGIVESLVVFNNGSRGAFLDIDIIVRDSVFKNNGGEGVSFGICSGNLFSSNGDAVPAPQAGCTFDDGSNICGVTPCP